MLEEPIVKKKYKLQKFPGKGGWTFAEIPEIVQNRNNPFGWVRVKGTIDHISFKQYHLMPMGNGKLFLPVKAAIRKKIKKEAGDTVFITLFLDDSKIAIPAEIEESLQLEPGAYQQFINLSEGRQKELIDWIVEAKKEETKVKRIIEMMESLAKGEK